MGSVDEQGRRVTVTVTPKSMLELEYDLKDKPPTAFPFKLIKHLKERFDLSASVLDVACGRGEHAAAFLELGLDVWCVDMSPAAAQFLKTRNTRLGIADLLTEPIPYADEQFDVVFCKSFIEHVNADRLMGEMMRVLKPGGKLIVLTVDWWYSYRMHYIDHTHGYGSPWMKHSLYLILRNYGLEDVVSEQFYYLVMTWRHPWTKFICFLIRRLPYPYIENFTNPVWKLVRFSNEVQLLGYGRKPMR
jgi:SAM-dependent methyltransferase